MNTNLNSAAQCYGAFIENEIVAFFSIIHFPHPKVRNFKRGHRLVVLPEYQGLGIGHVLSTHVCNHYHEQGYRVVITSNTRSLLKQRQSDKRWRVTHAGRKAKNKGLMKTSNAKFTFSYEYVGDKDGMQ
tara:strand:+ start:624 stop:1010 length:387 start_codon:yes stop_codon:yes gene_type:complete